MNAKNDNGLKISKKKIFTRGTGLNFTNKGEGGGDTESYRCHKLTA